MSEPVSELHMGQYILYDIAMWPHMTYFTMKIKVFSFLWWGGGSCRCIFCSRRLSLVRIVYILYTISKLALKALFLVNELPNPLEGQETYVWRFGLVYPCTFSCKMWQNLFWLFDPTSICLSTYSTPSHEPSLEPISLNLSILQSHPNPKTGKL